MLRSEKFGNLGPYPEGASLPKLLEWHLDFGTRPNGRPGLRGPRWSQAAFAKALTGMAVTGDGNFARNVSNWVNGKNRPEPHHLEAIKSELFGPRGGNAEYDPWRNDLDDAYRIWPNTRRHQGAIPPAPHHFLGRDDDVAALLRGLLDPVSTSARAILVRGGPGIGKSSLTRAVGNHAQVVEHFGELTRWFVELDAISTAVAMEDAIARAIGSDPAKGFKAALATLRQRPGLVVLDNLETPWDPTGERSKTEAIVTALTAIPGVAVLASFRGGRQPFRALNWTYVHAVDRLNLPFDRELFQRTAANSFHNDPYFDEFIGALDGIPLAIELVALRAYGQGSLNALWEQWKKVGAELASDPDYACNPDHLTSLPHSIELSFRSSRMTDTAARLFRYLGQLPCGVVDNDRDALLGDGVDGFNAGDALLRMGLAIERAGRLDLLSPIREHARRRHPPGPADQAAWPEHYLALAQHGGERVGSADGASATARVLPEFANIEAAFHSLVDAGHLEDVKKALEGFVNISLVGRLSTPILGELATACRKANDTLGEARCIEVIGDFASQRGEHEDAIKAYEEALTLYRHAGHNQGEANCIFSLGDIALRRMEHEAARTAYHAALSLYRNVGDVKGEANCTFMLGDVAFSRWEVEDARKAYDEALVLYRNFDHLLGEARCIFRLGDIARRYGNDERAREAFENARPLYRKAGSEHGEAQCTFFLGEIALRRSDYEGAGKAFGTVLPLFRKAGDIQGEANCVSNLGEIAFKRGKYAGAQYQFEKSMQLYRKIGDIGNEANSILRLGDIALRGSDHARARKAYEEALPLCRKARNVLSEAICNTRVAEIAVKGGEYERARIAYERALPLYGIVGRIDQQALCFLLLGNIAALQADYEGARKASEEALRLFRSIGDVQGEDLCFEALSQLQAK